MRYIAAIFFVLSLSNSVSALEIPYADTNGDGKVNVIDVTCATRAVLEAPVEKPAWYILNSPPDCMNPEGAWFHSQWTNADLTCDGKVDISDVQLLIGLTLGVDLPFTLDSDGDNVVDWCMEQCDTCGGIGYECSWDTSDAAMFAVLDKEDGNLSWVYGTYKTNAYWASPTYELGEDQISFIAVEAKMVDSAFGGLTWEATAYHENTEESCDCLGYYPWDSPTYEVTTEESGFIGSWWGVYQDIGQPATHQVGTCTAVD